MGIERQASHDGSDHPVIYRREGDTATIVLNRPERLNAMNRPLVERLATLVARSADDDAVRFVVLTGAGRAFSAGGDLSEDLNESVMRTGDRERDVTEMLRVARSIEGLRSMPKVTIAKINGPCVGAGLALACATDLRLASTTAVFSTAFVEAGLPGDFGGTWTLPRLVGEAKARELYLLSERFDADEALRIGLISRLVPPERLDDVTADVLQRLQGLSQQALALAKESLNATTQPLAAALKGEAHRTFECIRAADVEEARQRHRQGSSRRRRQ